MTIQRQVFKIDESQLNSLRRRIFINRLKLLLYIMLFLVIMTYFGTSKVKSEGTQLIPAYIFTLIVMLLTIYIAVNKLTKAYKYLEIALTDNGIEWKPQMMAYKSINWENLIIEEKADGTINLYDKSISAFSRKMYGKGWIIIPPEVLDRDILLNELIDHTQQYQNQKL